MKSQIVLSSLLLSVLMFACQVDGELVLEGSASKTQSLTGNLKKRGNFYCSVDYVCFKIPKKIAKKNFSIHVKKLSQRNGSTGPVFQIRASEDKFAKNLTLYLPVPRSHKNKDLTIAFWRWSKREWRVSTSSFTSKRNYIALKTKRLNRKWTLIQTRSNPLPCYYNYECEVGYRCSAGSCVQRDDYCASDADCGGYQCLNNTCRTVCWTQNECKSGFLCRENRCVADVCETKNCSPYACNSSRQACETSCSSNKDCASQFICSAGRCVRSSVEVCDGKDNDGDGLVDEGLTCGSAPTTEVCDGKDNDGDGLIDEGLLCLKCPTGYGRCGDICKDLRDDSFNCGSCGNVCGTGKYCLQGECKTTSYRDGVDKFSCNGQWVDPKTDSNHCGGCGNKCGAGEKCMAGRCQCPPLWLSCRTCATGQSSGDKSCWPSSDWSKYSQTQTRCVNPTVDDNHCGGCGIKCGADEKCFEGRCLKAGQSCNTNAYGVVTTNTCGAGEFCFTRVDGLKRCTSARCREREGASVLKNTCYGACKQVMMWELCPGKLFPNEVVVAAPSISCDGSKGNLNKCWSEVCHDLDTSREHCGSCYNACKTGEVCQSGSCVSCGAGKTICADIKELTTVDRKKLVDTRYCADLRTDPKHCGQCGNACRPGQQCVSGSCQ